MFQISAGKAESVYIPIVAAVVGNIDITVKAQSVLAADRVKRQLRVEVSIYSRTSMARTPLGP